MSRTSLWRVLAIAMPVLGALAAALPAVDLAYQLRAGAEILDSWAIPTVDSWTFTAAGAPWLDQQWGAQVLLALVYRLGGWTGLVVLRAVLVGLAFGLLLGALRVRAPNLGPRTSALVVIGAFIVSALALALRPQLFAISLFAAILLLLALRDRRPRLVWLIPVLAAAWANVHGTFPLALALCGLAWIEDLVTMPPSRGAARHRMLLVGLVTATATAVTPFGPAVWGYVANLTSNPTIASRVSEWQPPSPLTVPGAVVWLSVAAVALLVGARIRRAARAAGVLRGAIPWPEALALLLFGGLALASGRGTAWWPLVAAYVVAPWLVRGGPGATETGPAADRPTPHVLRRLNLAIVGAFVLAGVVLLPLWRPVGPLGVPTAALSYAPESLAAALNRLPRLGDPASRPRVWNPQVWGSWLELAGPDFAYALDSRIELFPKAVWDDADALASGSLDVLDRHGVAVVITEHGVDGRLEAALRASGEWATVFEGCDGDIWLPRSAMAEVIAAIPEACP